jgi:metal-responsive CopG/Arc/MetJ family transcriptional regulator
MNFSLHLNDELVRRLNATAQAMGKSRNALIREAVEEWLERRARGQWPEEVREFQGVPEAMPFEHARTELLPPHEPFDAVSA